MEGATGEGEPGYGPTEQDEEARLLRKYFLEIKQRDLFRCLGLDSRLYELIPVDDDIRLFGFMLGSPFAVIT